MKSFSCLITEIYSELSNLRTCPAEFASKMRNLRAQYRDDKIFLRNGAAPILTREGVAGLDSAIEFLQDLESGQSLQFSKGLTRAAQLLCDDIGPIGIANHLDSQGRTSRDRVRLFGEFSPGLGEVLNFGSVSGFEVVCSMIIDDGITTRPHRKLLLSDTFKQIGIGAAPHKEFGVVICCVLAQQFKEFNSSSEKIIENIEEHFCCEGEFKIENNEIPKWVDSAVKVTCVVKMDPKKRKIRRRSYWELNDGQTQITEEISSLNQSMN